MTTKQALLLSASLLILGFYHQNNAQSDKPRYQNIPGMEYADTPKTLKNVTVLLTGTSSAKIDTPKSPKDSVFYFDPCCIDFFTNAVNAGPVGSFVTIPTYDPHVSWLKPVEDTLQVIMLVSDTAKIKTKTEGGWVIYYSDSTYPNEVNWKLGYQVFNNKIHVKYLDNLKQPLPKSIIVWQSKSR